MILFRGEESEKTVALASAAASVIASVGGLKIFFRFYFYRARLRIFSLFLARFTTTTSMIARFLL